MTNDVKHLVMKFVIHLSSSVRYLLIPFNLFESFVSYYRVVKGSLYFLDTNPLSGRCVANIFTQSVTCLLIFLMVY